MLYSILMNQKKHWLMKHPSNKAKIKGFRAGKIPKRIKKFIFKEFRKKGDRVAAIVLPNLEVIKLFNRKGFLKQKDLL